MKYTVAHPKKATLAIKNLIWDIMGENTPVEIIRDSQSRAYVTLYQTMGLVKIGVDRAVMRHNYMDYGDTLFRSNFAEYCPEARGFAHVTLMLLHELGHILTDDLVPGSYNRDKEVRAVEDYDTYEEIQKAYFKLPDEVLATKWGAEWLSDPGNRSRAKQFEREFFACFKKRGRA